MKKIADISTRAILKIERLNKIVTITQYIEDELFPLYMADIESNEFATEIDAVIKASRALQDAVMKYSVKKI